MGEVGHSIRPEPGERGVEHRQFDVLTPGPAFSGKEGRRDRLGDRVGGGLVGHQGADVVGDLADLAGALLEGAVAYAAQRGAPVVEGYPVDNRGEKVDLTMAYVGTRKLFEDAGFTLASETDATSAGFPRVIMRRTP